MKIKTTKRTLAWALTFLMVLTLLPAISVPALADTADIYVPLIISSGYTADVVVEAGSKIEGNEIKSATYFDGGNEGANEAMYAKSLTINNNKGGYGLPDDGLLTFTHAGQEYKYQLADYSGNNAAQISKSTDTASPTTGTFVFTTPGAYTKISILGAAGNGDVVFDAIVRYTDGSTENRTFTAPDWATNGYCDVGRIKIKTGGGTNVGTFDDYLSSLYHFEIATDPAKLIKELEFTYKSDSDLGGIARANLMAVSGCISGSTAPAPSTVNPDSDVSGLLNTADHGKYVNGVGNGKFNPHADMTRAEAAQMFYNLLLNKNVTNTKTFPDVSENAWYYTAVSTLASIGIINGNPDGNFHPNDKITRAQFAAIAVSFAKVSPGETRFSDVPSTHWAADVINTAANFGWVTDNGKFDPERNITRAEAVTLVNKMLRRYPDKAYIDGNDDLTRFSDVTKNDVFYYEVMEAAN